MKPTKSKCLGLVWVLTASISLDAAAEPFQIINRKYGNLPTMGYDAIDLAFDQLAASINSNLPDIDVTNYLQGIANALTLSSQSVGSDYSTPFKVGMLGANLGVGFDLGDKTYEQLAKEGLDLGSTSAGIAAQASILVGMSLESVKYKPWGLTNLKNTRAYLNFFAYEREVEKILLEFRSVGLMVHYNAIRPKRVGRGILRWGGIDLGAGLKYNALKLETSVSQTESQSTSIVGVGTVTTSFNGKLTLGASSYNFSIPVEVSSSVRLFWIWSVFAGAGLDINLGQTKSVTRISGPINVSGTGLEGVQADAFLDLGQTRSPTVANARIFLGTGVEVIAVNLYAQVTQSLSGSLAGVSLGARAFW
jgi:hypothetical protein